jgi:hypothetical protein
MKITWYKIRVGNNKELIEFLLGYCAKAKYSWPKEPKFKTGEWFGIYNPDLRSDDYVYGCFEGDCMVADDAQEVNIVRFLSIVDNLKQTTFTLNEEYSAFINREHQTVKVGCQTFTFNTIRKLAKALD